MESEKPTLEELYREYNDRLVNNGTRMLKGDRHRAEEIVHDIWLELAGQEANGGLRCDVGRGQFYTYLFGSLWKGVQDNYRMSKTKKEGSLVEGERTATNVILDGWGNVPAVDGNPAYLVQAKELGDNIANVLSSLPQIYRETIELCVIDGSSDSKAAEIAGVNSKSTMRARLRRARQAFRDRWAYNRFDDSL